MYETFLELWIQKFIFLQGLIVNKNNSSIHFLDKLFGYLDVSIDLEEYFKSINVDDIPYKFYKPNEICYQNVDQNKLDVKEKIDLYLNKENVKIFFS